MEKKEFVKQFWAGIFFLTGICMLLMVILMIGKDKGLTRPKFRINILYNDVGGLLDGAPVRLAGVNVGNVSDIRFLEKEVHGCRVNVAVDIFSEYRKQLIGDANFIIESEGILGEKLIEIEVIEGGKNLDLSQPIIGEYPLDVRDLAEVFAGAAVSFTKVSADLNKIDYKGLSDAVAETAKSLSITTKGVNALLKEVEGLTKKSKRLLDRMEQKIIDGTLFKVF